MKTIEEAVSGLGAPDIHHANAASGWLDLGNTAEAALELEQMSREGKGHPEVLELRWRVHALRKEWELSLDPARQLLAAVPDNPSGWINEAYSLHELKQTRAAMARLLEAEKRFTGVPTVYYNLACYACQLGDLNAAWGWLERAAAHLGRSELKRMAREDPDLAPMRPRIEAMS